MKQGRNEEALSSRKLPRGHELVEVEFKEIKAECLFEQRAFQKAFPGLTEKEKTSILMREGAQYWQILRNWNNFKRVATAWLVMFFQQWK